MSSGVVGAIPKRVDVRSADETTETSAVEQVYREHVDFVWACLQRLGIRDRDLDDALQEVFVVIHQRLAGFRGDARMTTWLYAICLRIARGQRRRGYVRREVPVERLIEPADEEGTAEDKMALRERRHALDVVLDELDLEKRALLVMFEIDELSCEAIAGILAVPVGTVYSRLHGARTAFAKAVARFRARQGGAR